MTGGGVEPPGWTCAAASIILYDLFIFFSWTNEGVIDLCILLLWLVYHAAEIYVQFLIIWKGERNNYHGAMHGDFLKSAKHYWVYRSWRRRNFNRIRKREVRKYSHLSCTNTKQVVIYLAVKWKWLHNLVRVLVEVTCTITDRKQQYISCQW